YRPDHKTRWVHGCPQRVMTRKAQIERNGSAFGEKADARAEFPTRQLSARSRLYVEGQRPSRRVPHAGMLVLESDFWEGTMKLPHRRRFLHLAAGTAALPAISRMAGAQSYPTRPITIIVPYAPGGATDLTARVLSGPLAATLGQNVIVENVSG